MLKKYDDNKHDDNKYGDNQYDDNKYGLMASFWMASWPHSGWPRPALVASLPHPGWSHYHLSLMILPQYRSSVILNLFRVSQQKSADCFDFVQMQIFQRILIEITEFDDFFLKTSSVIFDLFRV